jgi:AraC-like DNA-binding protein
MKNADFFVKQVINARRFCLDLSPDAGKALTIVSGGVEKCSPDYNNQRDGFPFYCVEFVAFGEGSLRLKGKQYRLFPGSIFSYGPGTAHHIVCVPEQPMTKFFIDFTGRKALHYLKLVSLSPGNVAQCRNAAAITDMFDNMVKAGCRETRYAKEICFSLFEALFYAVAEDIIPLGSPRERAFTTFYQAKDIIDEKFLELNTLGDIARLSNVNPTYLCRLFKRFEGETPYHYLVRCKMRYAANLLHGGTRLVKEVAAAVNFDDQYQFSRTFKRIYNLSPERFAKLSIR